MTDANTQIIEAQGYTLVPGYIEPHAHSFHMYNPRSLGEYALARGTTTILHDNISFFLQLQQHEFEGLIEALEGMPVKFGGRAWTRT